MELAKRSTQHLKSQTCQIGNKKRIMDTINPLDLENLWDRLLSRHPRQVRLAFESLSPDQQAVVLAHLRRMSSEDGWHPEQQRSAKAALKALDNLRGKEP